MPNRIKACVKRIDQARDRLREDDFFKDLDAEALVEVSLNDPLVLHDALRVLASTFVQRNQKVLEEGVSAGIKLGKEFLK